MNYNTSYEGGEGAQQLGENLLHQGWQREKPDVLTKQQINQCKMDIEDTHPMRKTARIDQVLPFLSPFSKCFGKRKPEFQHALRTAILKKMEKKVPKTDRELMEEPFLMLGYGVNAYLGIMLSLSFMFIIITIFCIPIFMFYSENQMETMSTLGLTGFKLATQKFTLGNLGGAETFCDGTRLEAGKIKLTCTNGKQAQINHNFIEYGLINREIDNNEICLNSVIEEQSKGAHIEKCNDVLDKEWIDAYITKECEGKNVCHLDDLTIENMYNVAYGDVSDECNKAAYFFIQYACEVPKEFKQNRKVYGLAAGSIAVFIYLWTIIYFDYIQCVQINKFIDFDIKTITAGDYTVEFDIDEGVFSNFMKSYYDKTNPMDEISQFKLFIQTELEKRIQAMPDLGFQDPPKEGEPEHPIKIAQITFAYHNAPVIDWLKQRGTLIIAEKFEKVDELNAKIVAAIENPNGKLLNELQHPCSVFASFECEEGQKRACKYTDAVAGRNGPAYDHMKEIYKDFLGQQIEIEAACEPTDIIWENRSAKCRSLKKFIVVVIIFMMLCGSAGLIFYLQTTSLFLKMRYPVHPCSEEDEIYLGTDKKIKLDQYKNDALNEFERNYEANRDRTKTSYTGTYQCYCKYTAIHNADTYHEDIELNTELDGQKFMSICDFYDTDVKNSKMLGHSITAVIIVVNILLKTIIIKLITWIKEDTYSAQLASITIGVFLAQFFNTGFLLTLVNANMSEFKFFPAQYIVAGQYHDYMPQWYADVGQKITQTLIIQAIMPYINLLLAFIIPKSKQGCDRSDKVCCFGKKVKTNKTSMAQYKMLYSGPDYVIHFKYSAVLTVVFITCMYGMGMPLLFPLAAFNLFNQWVCERISVAYLVRLPPALDDQLTINCIKMLKYAPILLVFNGYWMLSNQQIFENKWEYLTEKTHTMLSSHTIQDASNLGPAFPLFFMSICATVLLIVKKVFADYLQQWGFTMSHKEIRVDENLPNFFDAVKLSQADELLEEQVNMRDNYGFQHNDPDTIHILDHASMPSRCFQGTPWYQILSNPVYKQVFNYIGAFVSEREKLIEDGYADQGPEHHEEQRKIRCEQSDLIMVLLNLAHIPDSIIHKDDFNFQPGWQAKLKDWMSEYHQRFNALVDNPAEEFQGYDTKFRFQDEELEERYMDFMTKVLLEKGLETKVRKSTVHLKTEIN